MSQNHSSHIEQKYLFPVGQKEMILDWLAHACLPDPGFDSGVVSTLYYDTPAFSHYQESSNGDFQKCKVRLRWYGDLPADRDSTVSCFLEIKRKQGAVCGKRRLELSVSSGRLAVDPFADEKIRELPGRVFELDYLSSAILVPVLLLRYHRHRYVDGENLSRIAVDTGICCTQANDAFFPGLPPVYLDVGVMEIKGMHGSLPSGLAPISPCLTRSKFSKYARCLEQLAQPLSRRV